MCIPKELEYVRVNDLGQSHQNCSEETPWLEENDQANEYNSDFITQVFLSL